jgi:hypothetical protein
MMQRRELFRNYITRDFIEKLHVVLGMTFKSQFHFVTSILHDSHPTVRLELIHPAIKNKSHTFHYTLTDYPSVDSLIAGINFDIAMLQIAWFIYGITVIPRTHGSPKQHQYFHGTRRSHYEETSEQTIIKDCYNQENGEINLAILGKYFERSPIYSANVTNLSLIGTKANPFATIKLETNSLFAKIPIRLKHKSDQLVHPAYIGAEMINLLLEPVILTYPFLPGMEQVYLSGAEQEYGEWRTAYKLTPDPLIASWKFVMSANTRLTEFKFLFTPDDLGETVPTSLLHWEHGINRRLNPTETAHENHSEDHSGKRLSV